MKDRISVGSFKAEPGKKVTGYLSVGRRYDGSPIEFAVTIISGAEEGPVLSLDACAHADEPEGAFAIIRLISEIDPSTMKGTLIATPILNTSAFEAGQRVAGGVYQYPTAEDLDRAFPGRQYGSLPQRFAHAFLTEIASKAQYVISLHSGGNAIYNTQRVIAQSDPPASLELAKSMGEEWPIIMEGHYAAGTLEKTEVLLDKRIPVVTPELGGSAGRLPETLNANVQSMKNGIMNVMRSLGMIPGRVTRPSKWLVVGGLEYDIRSGSGGLLVLGERCRLRERLPPGTHLARIVDPLGKTLEEITSSYEGVVLGFRTNPVVATGDTVIMLGRVLRTIE